MSNADCHEGIYAIEFAPFVCSSIAKDAKAGDTEVLIRLESVSVNKRGDTASLWRHPMANAATN
jgi:hypothetical protein